MARGERLQAAPFAEFTRALAIPKLSKRRVPHIAKREVREIDAAVGFTGRLDVDESFDVVAWIKPNGQNRICEPSTILFFRERQVGVVADLVQPCTVSAKLRQKYWDIDTGTLVAEATPGIRLTAKLLVEFARVGPTERFRQIAITTPKCPDSQYFSYFCSPNLKTSGLPFYVRKQYC